LSIPDARIRRGVRITAWYLVLVAVLGILSRCQQSPRDLERFDKRYLALLNEVLGLEIGKLPSDFTFRYLFCNSMSRCSRPCCSSG